MAVPTEGGTAVREGTDPQTAPATEKTIDWSLDVISAARGGVARRRYLRKSSVV